jgi:S-formylglutathione hydrolase
MRIIKSHKCFGGQIHFYKHESKVTKTDMAFSVFIPDGEIRGGLMWLSGLTCMEENFMMKAGAQRYLAESGLMVICPDTSPRGLNLLGEHENWDFGVGAGFYVDATTPEYKDHYRMFTYVSDELFELTGSEFKIRDRMSISGHSMGGHGALVIGLRERDRFRSVSAFSPIVNPMKCPWGQKAFRGYLGEDQSQWRKYDACELVGAGLTHPSEILIDQGTDDSFLESQLLTENFAVACESSGPQGQRTKIRFQLGYDHSYYFISTFIADHVTFHSERLG